MKRVISAAVAAMLAVVLAGSVFAAEPAAPAAQETGVKKCDKCQHKEEAAQKHEKGCTDCKKKDCTDCKKDKDCKNCKKSKHCKDCKKKKDCKKDCPKEKAAEGGSKEEAKPAEAPAAK